MRAIGNSRARLKPCPTRDRGKWKGFLIAKYFKEVVTWNLQKSLLKNAKVQGRLLC